MASMSQRQPGNGSRRNPSLHQGSPACLDDGPLFRLIGYPRGIKLCGVCSCANNYQSYKRLQQASQTFLQPLCPSEPDIRLASRKESAHVCLTSLLLSMIRLSGAASWETPDCVITPYFRKCYCAVPSHAESLSL